MPKMRLFWRIYFGSVGLLLTSVMAISFIAVFNTWRFDSLPLLSTIILESVIVALFVGGVAFIVIAIRGKTRKLRLMERTPP